MGYTYGFADNVEYSAADINTVIAKIVTSGVADVYTDGTSYNTSDLNKIAEFIASYGVPPGSGTTLKVVQNASNTVKVNAGSAFMADGAYITVDDDGVILSYTAGQENYVYIKNNLAANNSVDIVCSLTEGSGDIIPLATINADGTIADTRVYLKGKLPGYQSEAGAPQIITIDYDFGTSVTSNSNTYTATVDLGAPNYSYVIDTYGNDLHMGVYNRAANTYQSLRKYISDWGTDTSCLTVSARGTGDYDWGVTATFAFESNNLICQFEYKGPYGRAGSHSGTATFLVC